MAARILDEFGRAGTERANDEVLLNVGPLARQRLETEILARAEALPSPPEILAILQERAADDSAEVSEIEALLRQDLALVAKLLRLVNSSFFALRYRVNNISHAIVLLGFRTLRSLIFAAFADEVYRHEMPGYGYARGGLWRHSVRCAFTSRMLALRGVVEPAIAEDLFVAGLLHDLGKLLLWPVLRQRQEAFIQALQTSEHDILSSERLVTGIDHAEAGSMVARRWRLAENLVETILHHHAPRADLAYPKQASAVHLVNWMLCELKVGFLPAHRHGVVLVRDALELLELDTGAIEDLKCWLAQTGAHDAIDD